MSHCLTINCEEPWFSLLEKGKKPVEGRKGQKKYRDLKPGDLVCFQCVGSERSFIAIVEKIDCFDTILEYLTKTTLEKALPGIKTFSEALKIYSAWSTPEEVEALGFLGIWIKPIN
jgi:ASC-1-like (ASCH) protein